MTTYYPNSSTQQLDVLTTPYVRDQKFTSYSNSSSILNGNMMMYHLTSSSLPGSFSEISPGSSMNPENGVGIPSINGRNEMIFIPPNGDSICMQPISGPSNPGFGENGDQNLQGLSLSLSTQMSSVVPTSEFQFQYSSDVRPMTCKLDDESSSQHFPYGGQNNIFGALNNSQYSMNLKPVNCSNSYQYEQSGVASTLLKSKYLRPTQELLDEVVNVWDALKRSDSRKEQVLSKADEVSKESKDGPQGPLEGNESGVGSSSSRELSPVERQELQSKLDKLHSMLDEVDRKYKQYCNQMQILTSSFELVIGSGSSKPYTSLARKTISRHFRNLRDSITGQIQETRKGLGEEENGLGGSIPRLRYVDQQLRQQRTLQQFGLMRNAWRPQRGLPENAVTILRAWLFEHFLHPYPKDSEKIMLARQTGLTRSQVANWFINARVRLWKPMVEEMYKEEFGEPVILNSRSSPENTPKSTRDNSWGFEDKREEFQQSPTSIAHEPHDLKINNNHGFFVPNNELNTNGSGPRPNPGPVHGHSHLVVTNIGYQLPELGNFSVNNQISLALGLQQCEGNPTNEANIEMATSNYNPYIEQVNQQQHILDFVA